MVSVDVTKQRCEEFVEQMRIPTFDEDANVVMEILSTLVSNVLKQPSNEKYRAVPTSNKVIADVVDKYPQALQYLEIVGFQKAPSGEEYVLNMGSEDSQVLGAGLEVLNNHLNPKQPDVDPNAFKFTQAEVVRMGSQPSSLGHNYLLEKQVAEETARRALLVHKAGIPDRKLQVIDNAKTEVVKLSKMPANYSKKVDAGILKQAYGRIVQENKNNQGFRTEAMRALEALARKKVYTETTIAVQFPDDLVVRACFSPLETIADVEAQVKKCMSNPAKAQFYLFQRPFFNRKLDSRDSLEKLGCGSGAKFFAVWEKGAPEGEYIKDEFFGKKEDAVEAESDKPRRKSMFGFRKN